MRRGWLVAMLFAAGIAGAQSPAPNRALYTYQGADREQRLIEGAPIIPVVFNKNKLK